MMQTFSEDGWEQELEKLQLPKLTVEKLSAAIRAFKGKGKGPIVTEEEFETITEELIFIKLGRNRLLLVRNEKKGTLSLASEGTGD
ncbi:MAG: hypothetical protein Q7S86_04600 [bacterium]|nr:hypothetical protein [bacterium]